MDVVLRMAVLGWPFPVTVKEPAQFSLYGDGQAIYALEHQSNDSFIRAFELHHAQLSAEQVDQVLVYALGPGGLSDARERYEDVTITDMPTTVLEIHAGGVDKTVWVYALGAMDGSASSAPERAMFQLLASRLSGFAADVTSGAYVDLGPYRPDFYQASLGRRRDAQANAGWPWPDLAPADFERQPDGTLEHLISRHQVEAVVAMGIDLNLIAQAPDGDLYWIQIRPLLPEEFGNF